MSDYLQGLILGLAYVAPIGMQNLFVINTAAAGTLQQALLTAGTVIFFDITLALGCFLGIGLLLQQFLWLQLVLLLVGGLAVVKIGWGLARTQEVELVQTAERNWLQTAAAACAVTWFNPQAVIDGTLLLGAARASCSEGGREYFIAGVVSASCLWFMSLASVVHFVGGRLSSNVLKNINRICGVVLIFYGLRLLWHFAELLR